MKMDWLPRSTWSKCSGCYEINLMPWEVFPLKAQTLLAIVGPTLLSTKVETRESAAVYNPQRVLRRLAYDQGAVMISEELATSSILII